MPVHVLVGRAHEERVHSHRVGAVPVRVVQRVDDVALRLRHLGPVRADHPLVEEPGERLAERAHAHLVHDLGEEPRVEEVEHGMLDAADVLVDGQPVVGDGALERLLVVGRIGIADEVPGRVDERVHRVRLAEGRTAALRTGRVDPVLCGRERRAALRGDLGDVGQENGELVVRHGHLPTRGAVDDRDRTAPVALPREEPVAQAIPDRRLSEPALGEPGDDPLLGLGAREPVEPVRVDEHLVRCMGRVRSGVRQVAPLRHHDRSDLQPVALARTRSRARRARVPP